MWNYWILIVFFIVLTILWIRYKVEFFMGKEEGHYPGYNVTLQYTNKSDKIWDRHPVQLSVLSDIKSKNKKAHNYELENDVYLNALNKTFAPKDTIKDYKEYTVIEPVNYSVPGLVIEGYKNAVSYIANMIKMSPHFSLPDSLGSAFNQIQVVHDKLISYRRHRKIPACILNIELILYRESKNHAKHVGMSILAEKNKNTWTFNFLTIKINGVVFEDQIGLYPVVANDELNTNENLSSAKFPQPANIKFDQDVQFLEFCSSTNLDESKRKACIEVIGQNK